MLIVGSALEGYVIEASDGRIGTVDTLLFDDATWKIRWLVVDTGHWMTGRQVLIHPSAIGRPDHERAHLPVNLTKSQIAASPDIRQDQPVTMQMQIDLYDHYGWDRYWGPDFYGAGITGLNSVNPVRPYGGDVLEADRLRRDIDQGDPHLRSMKSIRGYHIHASDGSIGHVENFQLDDATWAIRYLIVDTRNWWPGAHVLISPYAVQSIDWDENQIHLSISRAQVKSSPAWDPLAIMDQVYERRLHEHYGWPGYGW